MFNDRLTTHAREQLEIRSRAIGLSPAEMGDRLAECLKILKIPCALVLETTATHRLVAIVEASKDREGLVVVTVLKMRLWRTLSEFTTQSAFFRAKDLLQ